MRTHLYGGTMTAAEAAKKRYLPKIKAAIKNATDKELSDPTAFAASVADELVIERIEIKDRTAQSRTWTRHFDNGTTHEYRRYRVDFGASADLLDFHSMDPAHGCFDSDFFERHGSFVEIRAADDEHRDRLFADLTAHVSKRNEQLAAWEKSQLQPLIAGMAKHALAERNKSAAQRESDEAAGWRPKTDTTSRNW